VNRRTSTCAPAVLPLGSLLGPVDPARRVRRRESSHSTRVSSKAAGTNLRVAGFGTLRGFHPWSGPFHLRWWRRSADPPHMLRLLPLAFVLCAGSAAAGGRDLDRTWVPAESIGAGWEVTREAPGEPARDPDLVGWGVRAQQARHYSRHSRGVVEVCSVEIWEFASVGQARAAEAGFVYPDWHFARAGSLLLMSRSLVQARGRAPQRSLSADCVRIGERIRARAAQLFGS